MFFCWSDTSAKTVCWLFTVHGKFLQLCMRHIVPDALVNDNEMTGWLGFYLCRILRSKVANAQKVLEAMVLIRVLVCWIHSTLWSIHVEHIISVHLEHALIVSWVLMCYFSSSPNHHVWSNLSDVNNLPKEICSSIIGLETYGKLVPF
jgi:hypothetical protein